MDLIWSLKKDAGLLNNVSIKQDQHLTLHITIDKAKLKPGGNSNFLGLFPYAVVKHNYIDSMMWQAAPYLQLEHTAISTISIEKDLVALNSLSFNEGFSPVFPASKALNINVLSRELKVNKLSFGAYLIGLSLKENQESNITSHQAMYIINSHL